MPPALPLPAGALPDFGSYPRDRYGFTLGLWVDQVAPAVGAAAATAPAPVFDARDAAGAGVLLSAWAYNGSFGVALRDAAGVEARWATDPTCSAQLLVPGRHYVAVVADGGPQMLLFFVDGRLCDGGPHPEWPNGFHLFDPLLGDVGVAKSAAVDARVVAGRVYNRALYTSELVGNWRAGAAAGEQP